MAALVMLVLLVCACSLFCELFQRRLEEVVPLAACAIVLMMYAFALAGLLRAGALAALGLWLLSSPASVIVLIQFSFAAVLLFHGVIDLQGAVSLMREGWPRWWIDLALAALTLVLGGVVLFNPFGTMEALTILIGLSLVYDGISDLVLIHRLSRAFREAERRGDVIETEGWSRDDE